MKIIVLLILITLSNTTYAALIDNGTFTTDTVTNIDWLDLTNTAGMKPSDVNFELRVKWDEATHSFVPSDYMGGRWRIANESETIDFISRNIGSGFGYYYSSGTPAALNADKLIQLLGITHQRSLLTSYLTSGMFINSENLFDRITIDRVLRLGSSGDEDIKVSYSQTSYSSNTYPGTGVGTYLVREHLSLVPIPGASLLFLSGLIFLFKFKRINIANK